MTKEEQVVYNTYLRISRSRQGKPFKLRQQFDDLNPESVVLCTKIAGILNRINAPVDDFITATYEIYGDDHYPLRHFASMRATKAYSIWLKKRRESNIDSSDTLDEIIKSALFIEEFCRENSLKIRDYPKAVSEDNISGIPLCLKHLKDGKISWYILFAFDNFDKYIRKVDTGLLKFMFGKDFHETNARMRTRFYHSDRVKQLSRDLIEKLETKQNNRKDKE